MIAHVGILVSDIERSKRFYTEALKPIGYQMIKEYGVTETRPAPARDLVSHPGPIYGSIKAHQANLQFTSRFRSPSVQSSMPFIEPRWQPAVKTMAHPDLRRNTALATTAPSSWVRMDTMLKPYVEKREQKAA